MVRSLRKRGRLSAAAFLMLALVALMLPFGSPGPVGAAAATLSDAASAGRFEAPMNPARQLHVGLFLKGPHDDQVPGLQQALADPGSPFFRHWLTPAQYGRYFGAAPATVQRTIAYVRAHGFTPSYVAPNNRYIVIDGPAAAVQGTFGTPMDMRVAPNGTRYYANRFVPTLPRELDAVQAVAGLDSYHVVHSHAVIPPNQPRVPSPEATVLGPGQFAFGAQDLYTAYDFNTSYTGSGQKIAIPVVRNFLPSDVFTYSQQFGIANPSYERTFLNGSCSTPCPVPTSAGDSGETALDTELSHAAAPDAELIVISQNDGLQPSQALNYQYIANVLGSTVQTVTSSYGVCESKSDPGSRTIAAAAIDQGVLEGQTWFSASGDDGADDCKNGLRDIDFPSGVPSLVAVGGTTLNTRVFQGNVQSYSSEYAWNDSGCGQNIGGATGGGASRFYGKPKWQVTHTFNDKVRDVPDIAAEADPYQQTQFPANCPASGGYWVINDGHWSAIGGTSGASPFWAGIVADLAQSQHGNLGLILPELYKLKGTTAYHQITIGNNSFNGVMGYNARAGYSQVTGLGSPDEAKFIAAFSQSMPPTPKPTAFPALQPHPSSTPAAAPTARAFIPIAVPSALPSPIIGVFNATVGANQGMPVQTLTAYGFPIGIAPAPSGNAVYVLQFGGGNIDKITTNVSPYTYLPNAYNSSAYRGSAIAASATSIFVSDSVYDQVDQVNIATSNVNTISVGHGPSGIAIPPNPKATAAYVALTGDNTMSVLNTSTHAVVQTVKVGDKPVQIALSNTGKTAYVVNSGDGTITPVTLGKKARPGKPVYVGGEPTSMAVNPSGTLGFVTNAFCPETSGCEPGGPTGGQLQLGVVEVLTLKSKPIGVECCIIVGQDPTSAAFEPTGHYVWVINGGNNSASVIDSFTNSVVQTVTTSQTTAFWEGLGNFVTSTPF